MPQERPPHVSYARFSEECRGLGEAVRRCIFFVVFVLREKYKSPGFTNGHYMVQEGVFSFFVADPPELEKRSDNTDLIQ